MSLDSIGANRVALLKAVLELTGLSLKEAKDLVDGVPSIVKEGLPQDQAEEVKNRWRKQGVRHHSNKAVPGDVFKVVCTSP